MSEPLYIVLSGLPGSGKSTLRAGLVQAFDGELVILSSDDYIEQKAAGFGSTYSETFRDAIKPAEQHVECLRTFALSAHLNVVHDQTNLSIRSRAKRLRDIPRGYTKVCLFVTVNESLRQARLLDRPGKVIPPNADAAMLASWQPPTLEEGFDIVSPGRMWRATLAQWLKNETAVQAVEAV